MNVTCSHCNKDMNIELLADLSKDSRITFRITPESGAMLQARDVGAALTAFAKLLIAADKELGQKTVVMLERVSTDADGSMNFDAICIRKK